MVKWKPDPDRFGGATFQLPKQEGESVGVTHDATTREPVSGDRRAYSLAKNYAFVNLYNYWIASDWPEPPGVIHDPLLHAQKKDEYERALFLTVASCIAEADPPDHSWHRLLWEKMPRELRINPPKPIRHAAGLAQHILDALFCAVDALADGHPIPDGVWHELTQRGGLVSLRIAGNSPWPESRRFGVVGRMPWWLGRNLEPQGILHRAADSIVGSFFLYLLAVELGGAKGPRLKRCAESGCHRVMVSTGRRVLCPVHQKKSVENRKSRRNVQAKDERREWSNMKGDLAARRAAFLRWRAKTPDARARLDRTCSSLLNNGINPAEVGYDVFLKHWKTSK